MGIKNLPKPGINFKATLGPGSFQKKLNSATRYGELKNLRDNQKAIVDTVKKYQGTIRIKGGLSRLQQRDAWLKIKKSTPKITYADKYEIKEVLKYLGRGAATGVKKPVAGGKLIKASDDKSYLTEKQVKRNLTVNKQRDELTTGVKRYKASLAGNVVSTKSIGAFNADREIGAGRIGINTGSVGFAVNYKNSLPAQEGKLPDNSAPKSESGGLKPIIKLAA